MAARVTHGFRFAMGVAALAVLLLSRAPFEVRLSAGQAPAAGAVATLRRHCHHPAVDHRARTRRQSP